MKKKFIVFLFLLATMFSGVYAAESSVDGYIIKIKDDYQTQNTKISLMSKGNNFNSLQPISKDWGMYYISKEEYESFDKSIIEYESRQRGLKFSCKYMGKHEFNVNVLRYSILG